MLYMRARFYDPQTQQFLTRDPIGASNQPYAYANRNPVNFVDPTGTSSEDDENLWKREGLPAGEKGLVVPGGGGGAGAANTLQEFAQRYGDSLQADPNLRGSTGVDGYIFAGRAKQYYNVFVDKPALARNVTIAVSSVEEEGVSVEVVAINGEAAPEAMNLIENQVQANGGRFYRPQGTGPENHAERTLYNAIGNESGFRGVTGISNYAGPCRFCGSYFGGIGVQLPHLRTFYRAGGF